MCSFVCQSPALAGYHRIPHTGPQYDKKCLNFAQGLDFLRFRPGSDYLISLCDSVYRSSWDCRTLLRWPSSSVTKNNCQRSRRKTKKNEWTTKQTTFSTDKIKTSKWRSTLSSEEGQMNEQPVFKLFFVKLHLAFLHCPSFAFSSFESWLAG